MKGPMANKKRKREIKSDSKELQQKINQLKQQRDQLERQNRETDDKIAESRKMSFEILKQFVAFSKLIQRNKKFPETTKNMMKYKPHFILAQIITDDSRDYNIS